MATSFSSDFVSQAQSETKQKSDSAEIFQKNTKSSLKCYRCSKCDGFGCPNMIPGLGGVKDGKNFQLNVQGWQNLFSLAETSQKNFQINEIKISPQMLRCGPVTGAVENIGYSNEEDFYYPYLSNAFNNGLGLCVGDGCPDEKLQFGLNAIKKITEQNVQAASSCTCINAYINAAFFLKPYPQENLLKRIDLVSPYAEYIGIDIDSFNIKTMRNLVNLEKKSVSQLLELKNHTQKKFVIKGVFTKEDIELVKQVKPHVAYISNHGGRVETKTGSTADFLLENASELKQYCSEIWIDGGIRTIRDIKTAVYYGASQIIIGRPLIRATFDNNYKNCIKTILSDNS